MELQPNGQHTASGTHGRTGCHGRQKTGYTEPRVFVCARTANKALHFLPRRCLLSESFALKRCSNSSSVQQLLTAGDTSKNDNCEWNFYFRRCECPTFCLDMGEGGWGLFWFFFFFFFSVSRALRCVFLLLRNSFVLINWQCQFLAMPQCGIHCGEQRREHRCYMRSASLNVTVLVFLPLECRGGAGGPSGGGGWVF